MINYEFCFLIAVFAFVYSYLLTRPHKILNGFYNRMWIFFKSDERTQTGKKLHWLFMLIIYCEQCIAGQLTLWIFLIFNYQSYMADFWETFITHLFSIAFSIFCAAVISHLYIRYIE